MTARPFEPGIDQAVAAAGGQDRLAIMVGVSQQAVSMWCRRGWAPNSRREQIEALTGVPADDLGPSRGTAARPDAVVQVALAPRVRVPLAALALGLSEKAIQRKIEDRKWREGRQYFRDPDGNVWIDIKGVMSWIDGG